MSARHPLRPHAPGQRGSLRGQAPLERRAPAKRIAAGFVESAELFRRHLGDAPLAERDGGRVLDGPGAFSIQLSGDTHGPILHRTIRIGISAIS
jgi:hypothetical protein